MCYFVFLTLGLQLRCTLTFIGKLKYTMWYNLSFRKQVHCAFMCFVVRVLCLASGNVREGERKREKHQRTNTEDEKEGGGGGEAWKKGVGLCYFDPLPLQDGRGGVESKYPIPRSSANPLSPVSRHVEVWSTEKTVTRARFPNTTTS